MTVLGARAVNFQSHSDTKLTFHERMNVIFGSTDSGKSAFVRSMLLVIANRPAGEKYRTHDSAKTVCAIKKENVLVKRVRTDTENYYKIGKDKYKRLIDPIVPVDVSEKLNLTAANVQEQKDFYFLVDITSGKVAKKLNEVAGLEIMDDVTKLTNSKVRRATSKIREKNESLVKNDSLIFELEWVKSASSKLKYLEKENKAITIIEDKVYSIEALLEELNLLNSKKQKFLPVEMISEIDELIKLKNSTEELEEKSNFVQELVDDIEKLRNMSSKTKIIDLTELEKLNYAIETEEYRIGTIEDMINQIRSSKKSRIALSLEIKENDKKYIMELKRLGKCPTCGKRT
jgi:chromosome segregation ATPase